MTDIGFPLFLDFEASSLGPNSYPIEVAWSDAGGEVESHLINPYCFEDWDDWPYTAQHNIHGLSREQLLEEGSPPIQVALHMNAVLDGQLLYCDGLPHDSLWLDALFSYCDMTPTFGLAPSDALFEKILPDEYFRRGQGNESIKLEMLKVRARALALKPAHRAANDVQYLVELYKLVNTEGGFY